MYYHRAYVLRKNMLDPKLGRMQWPTQSEGRWRSTLVSQRHQLRRGPPGARGPLAARPGVLAGPFANLGRERESATASIPATSCRAGPAGGQYTDWITSTAWEGQLVHPDDKFLAEVVDKLAANVRGWQKTYDPDGDGLLLVDSHWWTGMEYQPSFFFFSDFKASRDFDQPARQVSLERVDLTAYNYGNAARRRANLPKARPTREGRGIRPARRQDLHGRAREDVAARPAVLHVAAGRRQGGRRRQGSDRRLSVLFRHGALG